ncbi:MAG: cyclic pyranopterin monophosphate synthase MoaC [Desulfobacterales bacterium]|nr:cyclic pyranopterin monophosphate synthase MoaC [Desulfobacterales bacterium]
MADFTHIDKNGSVKMVDITSKNITNRIAIAKGVISMNKETFEKISANEIKKGNVLETARIAGIMASKKTSELIPMCHPINISHVKIDFFPDKNTNSIEIMASVKITAQTGVEMEALTAVSIAALTIYDMCKSYDKTMVISNIILAEKSGGKSGLFKRTLN